MQIDVAVLQSIPCGVHSLSDVQAARHVFWMQCWVVVQSAPAAHSTQRVVVASHTLPVPQSSEVWHLVVTTHALATQSCPPVQSAAFVH